MILTIIIFLLLLTVLVAVHEFGHYFMAKRAGMEVEEFGFGIPPRIWGKKIGQTFWSINALPIGGFVKVKGVENTNKKNENDPKSYQSKTWFQKFGFIIGGVIMNFLLAIIFLTIGYSVGMNPVWGTDLYKENLNIDGIYVVDVMQDGSAAKILEQDDLIISVNNKKVESAEQFKYALQQSRGKSLNAMVERDGKIFKMNIPVNREGKIGVGFRVEGVLNKVKLPVYKALYVSTIQTYQVSRETLKALGTMIMERSTEQIAGPVGIVRLTGQVIEYGFIAFLQFAALLSLSLGVINIIPFPALDGGRLLILIIEGILRRRLPQKIEVVIHGIGFALLMILIALVTIEDIKKFF